MRTISKISFIVGMVIIIAHLFSFDDWQFYACCVLFGLATTWLFDMDANEKSKH